MRGRGLRNLECIKKAFFVGVGEEEGPGLAGVGGFVEAAEVAGAAGHGDGGGGVEGLDAAEVEVLGVGRDGAEAPVEAAVGGAEDGAVGAGGPGDAVADVVDAAEVGRGGGGLEGPLPLRARQHREQKCRDERETNHGISVRTMSLPQYGVSAKFNVPGWLAGEFAENPGGLNGSTQYWRTWPKSDFSGDSAASSRRPLAARFAQMAIPRKSKNAPTVLQIPTAFIRTES